MGTYPPFDRGQEADVWTKEADGIFNAEAAVSKKQRIIILRKYL